MNKTLTIPEGQIYVYESPGAEYCLPYPLTVAVFPGSGGTVTVSQRVASTGAWTPVAEGPLAGTLAAAATDVLQAPLQGLRFAAATTAATVEIAYG